MQSELQEFRKLADQQHHSKISTLLGEFDNSADEMKSELRSQEARETKRQETLMTERHTEHLIGRLVQASERADRQDEEMVEMRKALNSNRAETISLLSGKFRRINAFSGLPPGAIESLTSSQQPVSAWRI